MNLIEKRVSLMASLEQHVGQINRINGAVAFIDDMLAEREAEQKTTQDAFKLESVPPKFTPLDGTASPVSVTLQSVICDDLNDPVDAGRALLLGAGCSVAEADVVAREQSQEQGT